MSFSIKRTVSMELADVPHVVKSVAEKYSYLPSIYHFVTFVIVDVTSVTNKNFFKYELSVVVPDYKECVPEEINDMLISYYRLNPQGHAQAWMTFYEGKEQEPLIKSFRHQILYEMLDPIRHVFLNRPTNNEEM